MSFYSVLHKLWDEYCWVNIVGEDVLCALIRGMGKCFFPHKSGTDNRRYRASFIYIILATVL